MNEVFISMIYLIDSGDLLELDEYGYWYFKDRSGDTFRWKGKQESNPSVDTSLKSLRIRSEFGAK